MATSNFVLNKGYDAAAAITKGRAVKFSAAETVTPVTADTDQIAGVAIFDVTAAEIAKGKGCSVQVMGAAVMEAAGVIAVGAAVTINSLGQAVSATSGDRVIGECREASAGAGAHCSVQLVIPGWIHP